MACLIDAVRPGNKTGPARRSCDDRANAHSVARWRALPAMERGMRYESGPANVLIANINLAPLVDVLLVLLALVVTTLPMAQATAVLHFQQRTACPPGPGHRLPAPIELHVDAAGGVFWNGRPLDDPALRRTLAQLQQLPQTLQPSVHLTTADGTEYGDMARVLLAMNGHGIRVTAQGL
ncbi:biopolymer transporter ExbD [Stenotrophomonas maltophilia]|uniref:biopolymer transporter ExbD n=1 Tax=Stenotrophomonas maltophilia TaxID=40324 RepID=UPI0039C0D1FA